MSDDTPSGPSLYYKLEAAIKALETVLKYYDTRFVRDDRKESLHPVAIIAREALDILSRK